MSEPVDRNQTVWPPAPTVDPRAGLIAAAPQTWLARLAAAPLELQIFAVFSAVASVSQVWLTFVGPKTWLDAFYPYIGASGFIPYLFGFNGACQVIFATTPTRKTLNGITAMLVILAGFGIYEFLTRPAANSHISPYLTVSPWQPLFTVALPLAWALVLNVCPWIRARGASHALDTTIKHER